jgi:hypothetical protein
MVTPAMGGASMRWYDTPEGHALRLRAVALVDAGATHREAAAALGIPTHRVHALLGVHNRLREADAAAWYGDSGPRVPPSWRMGPT